MERVIFTALTKQDLEALVIECVQICLKRHSAMQQQSSLQKEPPGQAGEAYINKRQAARLLSCSTSTIDNFARAKQLTRHYLGKAVRFDRQEVLALAHKHSTTKQRTQ